MTEIEKARAEIDRIDGEMARLFAVIEEIQEG